MFRIIGGDGREYGPVTADQLRQWLAEGRANAQTLTRRETEANWQPLANLPEFGGIVSASATGAGWPGVPPTGSREAALRLANPAGIALMLVGVIGLLWLLAQGILWAVRGPESNPLLQKMLEHSSTPEATRIGMMIGLAFSLLVGSLVSAFTIYCGWKLRRLESWGLVLTAAILSLLPCCGTSVPVCFLSLPVGVWVILVISRSSVKAHFR
ncbi:MAG: DUF4339 domain-containing protein [Limisphaerales bacterium]